jgi:hypothetical protein
MQSDHFALFEVLQMHALFALVQKHQHPGALARGLAAFVLVVSVLPSHLHVHKV